MTSVAQRAQTLRDIGQALRAHAEEMAQCITREMGKPIKQARAEVTKSAALCDWYAEHGPAMLNPEPTLVENQQAVIEYRPLGVIGDNAVEFSFMAGVTRGSADTVGGE